MHKRVSLSAGLYGKLSNIILFMIKILLKLPRKTKKALMLFFDFFAILGSLFVAFAMRFGHWFYPSGDSDLLLAFFAAPLLALPIFISFRFYHELIRYVGFKALWRIIQGASMYAISWGLITFMAAVDDIPRSVILINWLLVIIVVSGSRLLVRWLLAVENVNDNVLIYGAGSAGRQLSTALNESNEYKPVAFIDDANDIYHHSINGLKIYSHEDLEYLIERKNIKEVLLAIPSISRIRRTEIIS